MKLNNPIQVRDSLTEQKRIDIDLGVKLSNRVNDVRQNLNEEEMKYQKFHDETIKQIQLDIDNKILEKNQLLREIEDLEIERTKLTQPLDREWEKIKTEKDKIKSENEEIARTSKNLVGIIQRNESKEAWNKMESRRILNLETEVTTLHNKAVKLELEAEDMVKEAKKKADSMLKPLLEREKLAQEKENQALVYLETLKIQEEEIKAKYQDIANQEKRLADQRGILERQKKRLKI